VVSEVHRCRRVRHVKFRSTEDVDEGKIRELIDQALEQATATR
jgi:hypothetical protein